MLLLLSIVIGVFSAACTSSRAADRTELGLIVERASGGFWASFPHPIAEGQPATIRISPDSWDVGTARVQWSSPFPPYEAYLTDVTPARIRPLINSLTPYQSLFNDKAPAGYVDRGDLIAPGLFVAAKPAPPGKTNDVLRGLLDLLDSRPEFKEHLRAKRVERADWDDVHMILDQPLRLWHDPITARIVRNIRDLLRERNNVQGRVPGFWFQPDESRKKPEPAGANPNQ